MDKAQLIALLFLMKTDTSHLTSLGDYIKQFDVVEENVRSILETLSEEQTES